jgi:hypothetical protein
VRASGSFCGSRQPSLVPVIATSQAPNPSSRYYTIGPKHKSLVLTQQGEFTAKEVLTSERLMLFPSK